MLKVGGESFSVGDEITCVYSVTCPDSFINFQATLNYDSSVLKATGAKMQGDASSGSVVNYKLDGKVKFNGINLAGYDYNLRGHRLRLDLSRNQLGNRDRREKQSYGRQRRHQEQLQDFRELGIIQ